MSAARHEFTAEILAILERFFGDVASELFERSELLQYINIKAKAATRGSKSRAGFANHYAIYVLVEDYIQNGFHEHGGYSEYDGAQFSQLFKRQRELPFGSKLQNHALNHRLNEEFKKYFPQSEYLPIIRDASTNKYWINENLIRIRLGEREYNLALAIVSIIDAYVGARQSAFTAFMDQCRLMMELGDKDPTAVAEFVKGLLQPNVDARVFEIVSFAILKQYYADTIMYWGYQKDELTEERLVLYKTGRTNANDGGIDFVMRPLGKFFQVTETIDAGKYFLDIDKVQRYPITFVVKSDDSVESIITRLEKQASERYGVKAVVKRYMDCIEEVITSGEMLRRFEAVQQRARLSGVMDEIVLQSRVEFNVEEEGEASLAFDEAVESLE
jgi:hypothetical protein